MQTKQQTLAQKLARIDTLETYKRAMLADYMPIKNELAELKDQIEQLELELLSEDDVENDKKFDELIDSIQHDDIDTSDHSSTSDEPDYNYSANEPR